MRCSGTTVLIGALCLSGCATGGRSFDLDRERTDRSARSITVVEAVSGERRGPTIAVDTVPSAMAARTRVGDGVSGNGLTRNGTAAISVDIPLAVDGSAQPPVANDLIGTVNALIGDGLPLRAAGKNADPETLLRVRGDTLMLLWRYPF